MIASPLALVRRLPPTVQLLVAGTLVNKIGGLIVPYLSIVLSREFALTEALPAIFNALRLDRSADRPERLRGRSEPSGEPAFMPATAPEG